MLSALIIVDWVMSTWPLSYINPWKIRLFVQHNALTLRFLVARATHPATVKPTPHSGSPWRHANLPLALSFGSWQLLQANGPHKQMNMLQAKTNLFEMKARVLLLRIEIDPPCAGATFYHVQPAALTKQAVWDPNWTENRQNHWRLNNQVGVMCFVNPRVTPKQTL